LPVPIIVSEPAVCCGGGAALLFFHASKKDEEKAKAGEPLGLPPSVSAAFGMGTSNGTWGAGAGHFSSWLEDRLRYTAGGGYAELNLTYYADEFELDYTIESWLILQELQVRLGKTDFFLGARYRYASSEATRKSGPTGILPTSVEEAIGGIGVIARYDSRDNLFSPTKGQDISLIGNFNDPHLGGDSSYQELMYQAISYHPFPSRVVLGLRLEGASVWGATPFYARPYVKLRGIPAMRFQDDNAGAVEAEVLCRVYKRWSLVAFLGGGWIVGPNADRSDNPPIVAGGGGFRYLIARQLGIQAGIDVARGPEDTAFYIQVGGAW